MSRSDRGLPSGQSAPTAATLPPGRRTLLGRLAGQVMDNPGVWLRLLTLRRLKNLYITLFRQPAGVREQIFEYYFRNFGRAGPVLTDAEADSLSDSLAPDPAEWRFPPPSGHPRVSILIPVFNQLATTLRCLRAVAANSGELDYEVLIADDGSAEETGRCLRDIGNLRVYRQGETQGFLRNCNRVAARARGDLLVLLNNDTLPRAGWLSALVDVMAADPRVGIVGPQLLFADGSLQEAGGIVWRDASGWNYGRDGSPDAPEYNYLREVDYVSGACLCIRRSLWERLGGFDERFAPAYYEDTDLAFAARSLGYRVLFQPLSRVVHLEGVSHGNDPAGGIKRFQAINAARFRDKWAQVLDRDHLPNGRDLFLARDRGARGAKTILVIDHHVPFLDRDAGSRSTYQYLRLFVESGLSVKFIGDNFHAHQPYTRILQQLGIEVLHGAEYAANWGRWIKENGAHLDYVYLHRPQVAERYIDLVRRHTAARILYFGHDLHYLRVRRQARVEQVPGLEAEAENWRRLEFRLFERCDVIYYPSSVEVREVRARFPAKTVRTLPLFAEDPVSPLPDDFDRRRDFLFVGGFGHPPNLDAVLWMAREILPAIRARVPRARLLIVGSSAPRSVLALQGPHLGVLSDVSDTRLAECYADARVVLVPLRYGAGIKGKILEALRLQVPVVTTLIGAEGLEGAGDYLAIGETAGELAAHAVALFTEKARWLRMRERGRVAFNAGFSKAAARAVIGRDLALNPPRPATVATFENVPQALENG